MMKKRFDDWMIERKGWDWSFRFIFMFMYIALVGTVVYIGGLLQCGTNFVIAGNTAFIIFMDLLLGLEIIEDRRYRYKTPRRTAIILLLVRMALTEAVVAIDCGEISILLYLIVPFYAYFSFGSAISNGLSVFYLIVVFGRLWLVMPRWYLNYQTLFVVVVFIAVFIAVLMFMRLLAQVIQRDEQSRQRTEQLLADLEVSHGQLQVYAEEAAELAAMEKRNRLARDIHDSLGHFLTAVDGRQAVQLAQDSKPDVILMDVRMPVMDGIVATKRIQDRLPDCQILMLTTFDDDEYIIRSLQAGASGYLLKDIAAEDLAQAVRLVNAGIYQLAPAVAGKLVGQLGNKQQRRDQITTAPGVVDELTERELLVPFFVVTLLSA